MVLASLIVPRITMRTAVESGTKRTWMTSSSSGWALPATQAARVVEIHGLGQKARAGVEAQNASPARGGVAGLFQQFAFGGDQIIFAFVDASGGQFPEKLAGGVAVLAFEQNAGLGSAFFDREDHDRSGVTHDVAAGAHAAGFENFVGSDAEGRSVVDLAGGEDAGWLRLSYGMISAWKYYKAGVAIS